MLERKKLQKNFKYLKSTFQITRTINSNTYASTLKKHNYINLASEINANNSFLKMYPKFFILFPYNQFIFAMFCHFLYILPCFNSPKYNLTMMIDHCTYYT